MDQTNMATSSPKDKFDAAVRVIRGLPKNGSRSPLATVSKKAGLGSFQPSHELMLKFYAYFKQATEGPCTSPKPGFWDIVNRKKWDAWTTLGDMESEKAMLLYVDELKKVSIYVGETFFSPQVVETMPQTEAVTDFLNKLENFYEMVDDPENLAKLVDGKKQFEAAHEPPSVHKEEAQEELNHSYNVTQLLKQDMKRSQQSSGVVSAQFKLNGLNGNHSSDNDSGHANGNHHSSGGDDTEDEDEIVAGEDIQYRGKSNGQDEHREDGRLAESSVLHLTDSETENEEFCDTSDEPIEGASTSRVSSPTSRLAPQSASARSSKAVHFDPAQSVLSDSLVVNTSLDTSNLSQLISREGSGEVVRAATDGRSLDIATCRGGEEDSDRRKRGGQGTRDGAASGSRGSRGGQGSGDPGDHWAGGAGGDRGLQPGPGGGGGGRRRDGRGMEGGASDINEQIVVTLLRLQQDMSGVLNRLNSLEVLVKEGRVGNEKRSKPKGWWPLHDLSLKSSLIIFVWPFIVHFIITYICRRRQRRLKN